MSAVEALAVRPAGAAERPASLGLVFSYLLSIGLFVRPRWSGQLARRVPLWKALVIGALNLALLGPVIMRLAANPALREILRFPWVFFGLLAGGYFVVLFFVVLPFVPRPGANGACLRHMVRSTLLGTSLIWVFAAGYALVWGLVQRGCLRDVFDQIPAYVGATGLAMAWTSVALIRAATVDYRRPEDFPAAPEPRCDDCGYDLRGSARAGVCPECGRPVAASLDPAARSGTAWENDPHARHVRRVLEQMLRIAVRPQALYAQMPARGGQDAARRWLALNAVLVALFAAPMIPALALTGTSLLQGIDFSRWPLYAMCFATAVVWAFLGLMMVGVETLGLTVVSRFHGQPLMLATASKVTSYASTLLIPWVVISLLYFVALTIGWESNFLHAGPLAPWRDHIFVLSIAVAQSVGLIWFEWTVYRGLRKVQYANC